MGIGTAGKVIGAGLGKLATAAMGASVPTAETIGPMKTAAYKAADDLGAAYTPQAYNDLVDKIISDAKASNINEDIHPNAVATIRNLQDKAANATRFNEPISLTDLDQARQMVGRDVTGSPAEKYFGNQIRGNIDDFIANAGPGQMAGGSGPDAAAAIQNARDLNTRDMKSQALAEALGKAGPHGRDRDRRQYRQRDPSAHGSVAA